MQLEIEQKMIHTNTPPQNYLMADLGCHCNLLLWSPENSVK